MRLCSNTNNHYLTALLLLLISSLITSVTSVHTGFRGLKNSNTEDISRELGKETNNEDEEDDDEVNGNTFLLAALMVRKPFCVPDADRGLDLSPSFHTENARWLGALRLLWQGAVFGGCFVRCQSLCATNLCYANSGVGSRTLDTCVCQEDRGYLCVQNAECTVDGECKCIDGFLGDGTVECVPRNAIVGETEATITFSTGSHFGMASKMTPRIRFISEDDVGGGYRVMEHTITSQLPGLGETRSYIVSAYPGLTKIQIWCDSDDPNKEDEWFFNYLEISFDGSTRIIDLQDENTGKVGVWLDFQPYDPAQNYMYYRYRDFWEFYL